LYRNIAARRRRRLDKINKDLCLDTFTLCTDTDITKIRSDKRAKNYISCRESNTQETLNSFLSSNPIEKIPTSISNNERMNRAGTVKVTKVAKSLKEENASIKSHQQRDSDGNMSAVENQPKSQRSSVTVSSVKKSQSVSEIIKDNEPNKSPRFHDEENENSSTSSAKIHVIKLPRNKVSASSKTHVNTVSASTDRRTRSQSNTDKVNNNNSVNDIPSQIPSVSRTRNIDVKANSAAVKEAFHTSNSTTKDNDNARRRRASTFSSVTVSKIKKTNDNIKLLINQPTSAVLLNNDNKMGGSNRVTVVSVKKQ
jgi:hypothetical protein